MNDIPYSDWYAMSDKALGETIGNFVKHHRLSKNLTQEIVSKKANISRSTLSLLEKGETVTLSTLLQVLRTLELLHVLDSFKVQKRISPIALAKLQQEERKRASKSENTTSTESDW